MKWVMYVYAAIYSSTLLFNLYYWLKHRGKMWIFLYELLSGAYMVFLILAYFNYTLRASLTLWTLLPAVVITGIDFYMSLWGDLAKLTPEGVELNKTEIELARCVSVIFASPCYIIAFILLVDKLHF